MQLEPLVDQSVSSLQQSVQQSVVSTNSESDQCGGSSNQVEKDGKCSSSSSSKVRFPPSPPLGKPTGDVKGVRFPSYGNWGSPLLNGMAKFVSLWMAWAFAPATDGGLNAGV